MNTARNTVDKKERVSYTTPAPYYSRLTIKYQHEEAPGSRFASILARGVRRQSNTKAGKHPRSEQSFCGCFLFSSGNRRFKLAREMVAFRADVSEREKLEALARGEQTTVSEVLRTLIRRAPVEQEVVTFLRLRPEESNSDGVVSQAASVAVA